jgi:hypothetical protein
MKYDFESICFGHYGAFYGPDIKDILNESKAVTRSEIEP